jgi:hypothetical protein
MKAPKLVADCVIGRLIHDRVKWATEEIMVNELVISLSAFELHI